MVGVESPDSGTEQGQEGSRAGVCLISLRALTSSYTLEETRKPRRSRQSQPRPGTHLPFGSLGPVSSSLDSFSVVPLQALSCPLALLSPTSCDPWPWPDPLYSISQDELQKL